MIQLLSEHKGSAFAIVRFPLYQVIFLISEYPKIRCPIPFFVLRILIFPIGNISGNYLLLKIRPLLFLNSLLKICPNLLKIIPTLFPKSLLKIRRYNNPLNPQLHPQIYRLYLLPIHLLFLILILCLYLILSLFQIRPKPLSSHLI